MEIAYVIQPAGNVNLRACVAGWKRARNSSVRAEGRWHVLQLEILLSTSSRKKQGRALLSLLASRRVWRITRLFTSILFTLQIFLMIREI